MPAIIPALLPAVLPSLLQMLFSNDNNGGGGNFTPAMVPNPTPAAFTPQPPMQCPQCGQFIYGNSVPAPTPPMQMPAPFYPQAQQIPMHQALSALVQALYMPPPSLPHPTPDNIKEAAKQPKKSGKSGR